MHPRSIDRLELIFKNGTLQHYKKAHDNNLNMISTPFSGPRFSKVKSILFHTATFFCGTIIYYSSFSLRFVSYPRRKGESVPCRARSSCVSPAAAVSANQKRSIGSHCLSSVCPDGICPLPWSVGPRQLRWGPSLFGEGARVVSAGP